MPKGHEQQRADMSCCSFPHIIDPYTRKDLKTKLNFFVSIVTLNAHLHVLI